MSLFADRITKIDTENAFKIGPHIKHLEDAGHKVIKLNLGEPDFNLPEFVKEELKRQIDKNNTHYCDPQGCLVLREAVARQMSETRNLNVTPDRVVVFPGGKPPIGFCQEVYTNPGDEIIYPSPGFPIYESFIKYVGATPVPLHLDEEKNFSFTGKELEKLITNKTKLIYINFPSNPTGGVATPEQLEGIADVINKKCSKDVRIYSDEIYEYILFDGSKHISIATLPGMENKTIIVSGMSKTFAWTGGRIGWAVFPTKEEALVFKNLNINYFSCVPPYNQAAAALALNSPLKSEAINKMVSEFEKRRNYVVKALNEIPGIKCQNPVGAFYVFPNIAGVCENLGVLEAYNKLDKDAKLKASPSTLFQMFLLYVYHVATMDRKSFGRIGSEGKHYLRLSIATDLDSLKIGMEKLKKATTDKAGFAKYIKEGKNLY